MTVYDVTITLGIGDLEVEFDDDYEPTDDVIHDELLN